MFDLLVTGKSAASKQQKYFFFYYILLWKTYDKDFPKGINTSITSIIGLLSIFKYKSRQSWDEDVDRSLLITERSQILSDEVKRC